MPDELFDICDSQDNVIGQALRSRVHAENLLHRAVHIWVWNSSGEFLLQTRSATKDQFPGCYTSSASGHVDAGEDYETAAHRELGEELQLSGPLSWGMKLPAGPQTAFEHSVLFHLQSDNTPVPDSSEISHVAFVSPSFIAGEISRIPNLFTPPFRELFIRWWELNSWSDQDLTL